MKIMRKFNKSAETPMPDGLRDMVKTSPKKIVGDTSAKTQKASTSVLIKLGIR